MNFKARCSSLGTVMTGEMGLTQNQEKELKLLLEKHAPLTGPQEEKVKKLKAKRDDETLPKTVRSHLDAWMKSKAFGVELQIKSKYLDKGNTYEAMPWLCLD